MPVVQLQNDTGENLGKALGAVGGYLATKKTRDADKATALADKQHTTAREDAAAADAHANIQSQIKQRDAGAAATDASNLTAKTALGAYQANFPLLASATVGPDGKKLTGPALQTALVNLRNKAMNEGAFSDSATHEKNLGDFNTEIARITAASAPKLTDVTHGMQQLPATAAPDVAVKHWMDAASKVANSDMSDDQKKTAIAMYQKNAADALARVPKPETPADAERARHDKVMEGQGGQRIQVSLGRGAGGGGYNSSLGGRAQAVETKALGEKDLKSALRDLETSNLPRRDRTEVRQDITDQFRTPGTAPDTSGLDKAGAEAFQHDMTKWAMSGSDPDSQPDPTDKKYEKRRAAASANNNAPPAAKPVMHNGKPYYLHSDGNYYLTP